MSADEKGFNVVVWVSRRPKKTQRKCCVLTSCVLGFLSMKTPHVFCLLRIPPSCALVSSCYALSASSSSSTLPHDEERHRTDDRTNNSRSLSSSVLLKHHLVVCFSSLIRALHRSLVALLYRVMHTWLCVVCDIIISVLLVLLVCPCFSRISLIPAGREHRRSGQVVARCVSVLHTECMFFFRVGVSLIQFLSAVFAISFVFWFFKSIWRLF